MGPYLPRRALKDGFPPLEACNGVVIKGWYETLLQESPDTFKKLLGLSAPIWEAIGAHPGALVFVGLLKSQSHDRPIE